VHALDTVDREAFCIDLDALARQEDLYRLGLALGGGGRELIVRDRTRPLAVVDRTTFEVREPAPEPRHAAPAPDAADGPPWTIGATAAGAVLLAAAAALVARRRRSAGPAQVDEEIREGQLLH
jgi:hypothetical protein